MVRTSAVRPDGHRTDRICGSKAPQEGVPPPTALAKSLFDRASDAESHYLRMCRLRRMDSGELGRLLSGDPQGAAPWIESAARYGLPEAQVRIAQMLLDGVGVARDEPSAVAWFSRAARKGSPEAMNMVGRCHENGWGVAVDLAAARDWYRRSAETGHDWGQYNYANLLFDGRGVGQDQAQAFGWYQCAANQDHTRAMNLLARCLEEGWGVERNWAQAVRWYRRSAEGGYFRAQYNLATLRVGACRIDDETLGWFEKACQGACTVSRPAMILALKQHADQRLAALGERLARLSPQPAL